MAAVAKKIRNPVTGRLITPGGATWRRLQTSHGGAARPPAPPVQASYHVPKKARDLHARTGGQCPCLRRLQEEEDAEMQFGGGFKQPIKQQKEAPATRTAGGVSKTKPKKRESKQAGRAKKPAPIPQVKIEKAKKAGVRKVKKAGTKKKPIAPKKQAGTREIIPISNSQQYVCSTSKDRKGPIISAAQSNLPPGTLAEGVNQNIWQIVPTSKGVQRWKDLKVPFRAQTQPRGGGDFDLMLDEDEFSLEDADEGEDDFAPQSQEDDDILD